MELIEFVFRFITIHWFGESCIIFQNIGISAGPVTEIEKPFSIDSCFFACLHYFITY